MKFTIDVDTNHYRGVDEWSINRLQFETLHLWRLEPQSSACIWTIEGDAYCGTKYSCEIDFAEDVSLLEHFIHKVKEVCGDRFLKFEVFHNDE